MLYVVHGILHLHGYNDVTPPERRRMRAAERRLMARLMVSTD
jgi:ssRNA-specific RNase YbeY (16S rRNA maturation enzyme)